jgi:urease accessory protein
MTMTMTMADDLLALSQWLQLHDSAFPAGRMVHSNGIENWLHAYPDADDGRIERLMLDYVAESVATLDGVITAAAWKAITADELIELDLLLLTYKTSSNARSASQQPGLQLATTARRVGLVAPDDRYLRSVIGGSSPGNLAVVEGAIQATLWISQRVCVLGTLRSALAAALSAGVRLGRIGAMKAQQIMVRHHADLVELVETTVAASLDDLASNTFHLEIHGMRHERQSPRLFAT